MSLLRHEQVFLVKLVSTDTSLIIEARMMGEILPLES